MPTRHSGHERIKDDFYREPKWAVHALMQNEKFYGPVYDPCCGTGQILRVAHTLGHEVRGSDIVMRRDTAFGQWRQIDFIAPSSRVATDENIITNIPFKRPIPFIERALDIGRRKIAFFLPLRALAGQKRRHLIEQAQTVHVFSGRVNIAWGDNPFPEKGGSDDFVWIVWNNAEKRITSGPILKHLGGMNDYPGGN